jgi:hypothetical protein
MRRATSAEVSSASRTPRLPVHALALPLLQQIALMLDEGRTEMFRVTQAARTVFVVNVPHAQHGDLLATIPTSGNFEVLIPAATPQALNPFAAVTPPSTSMKLLLLMFFLICMRK